MTRSATGRVVTVLVVAGLLLGVSPMKRTIAGEPYYVLQLLNLFDEWEDALLVFGYMDNALACQEVLEALSIKNPAREYRCRRAPAR